MNTHCYYKKIKTEFNERPAQVDGNAQPQMLIVINKVR